MTETSSVLCLYFVQGFCSYGDECRFSHDLKLLENEAGLPKQITLYKTELCRTFMELGTCKFGERCQFAHGHDDLRTVKRHKKYKTKKCKRFHEEGVCPFGNRCCFIHGDAHNNVLSTSTDDLLQIQTQQSADDQISAPSSSTTSSVKEEASLKKFKFNELEEASEPTFDQEIVLDVTKKRSASSLTSSSGDWVLPVPATKISKISLKKSMDEQTMKRSLSVASSFDGRGSWDPMLSSKSFWIIGEQSRFNTLSPSLSSAPPSGVNSPSPSLVSLPPSSTVSASQQATLKMWEYPSNGEAVHPNTPLSSSFYSLWGMKI